MYLNIGLVSASTLIRPFDHGDPASLKLFYLFARGIVAVFGLATILLLYFLVRGSIREAAVCWPPSSWPSPCFMSGIHTFSAPMFP